MATSSQLATAPASVGSPTFPDLFDLAYEARIEAKSDGLFYDPWLDLGRRRGVEVDFHNPGTTHNGAEARGLTYFHNLRVTLRFGMMDVQMRCTLAHELVHLDRGPRKKITEARDEAQTSLRAAQRLVNPTVFERLQEITDGDPDNFAIHAALNVDRNSYSTYRRWRARCKPATALKAWGEARECSPWPAPWIEETVNKHPGSYPALEAVLESSEPWGVLAIVQESARA